MEQESFLAGVVQLNTGDDWEYNQEQLRIYARQAADQGVQYLQFPETSDYIGEGMGSFARRHAGEARQFFSELAKKHHIYLNCGSVTEHIEGSKPANTSYLFAPDGSCIARYRKLHLFDVAVEDGPVFRESDEILAGDCIVNAATDYGSFGLSICYDLRFPELYRRQALLGAEVLCVSANFTRHTGAAHWKPLLQARAIENTCYVIAAGQCGNNRAFEAYGHSMVLDPWGEVLAEAGDAPELLTARIDPGRLREVRRQLPCLTNRRGDVYP